MTKVMERSPATFAGMGEEDIRQHFLVQLNANFQGKATGETFNHKGKTDILIRDDDANLFIGECKFWTGEKGYIATLDQVLGYVTWRDTKTAVVVFNRNKGFSDVIEKIKASTKGHPQFKRGPIVEGEPRLRYIFRQPNDANREVIVTVLAFDIPKPDNS